MSLVKIIPAFVATALFHVGGQFLVGGLEFLVGGLEFLVAGLGFFLEGLHFFAGGPQLLAELIEVLLQRRQLGAGGGRVLSFARPFSFRGRVHIRKDDHHQPLQRLRLLDDLKHEVHRLPAAIGPDHHVLANNRVFLPERPPEGVVELEAQALAGHGKDIHIGLAHRRLQIFARPPADENDVAIFVNDHRRRGIPAQKQLLRLRLEVGWLLERPRRLRPQGGNERAGKRDLLNLRIGFEPPVKPRPGVQRREQVAKLAHGLGAAQEQKAAGIEAIVKERYELLLQLRRQVDEQVAAAHQVEFGERRVHDDVLRRKDHHLPDRLGHLVAVLHLDEVLAQPLRRQVRGDVGREYTGAGFLDGLPVQVGREDLERVVAGWLGLLQHLFEEDGQGIGFLAGGAAGDPDSQRAAGRAVFEQRRQHPTLQLFPHRRVAEEARYPDQQFLEQQIRLAGILLEKLDIAGDAVDLVNAHAPLDAAVDGGLLVEGEIVAGLRPQQDDDLLEGAMALVLVGQRGLDDQGDVLEIGADLAGQQLHRADHVRQPGVNGAAGHAVELGRGRVLHEDHPRLALDGFETQRAVRAHARKNDANAALFQVIGQGAQKEINRQPQPARRGRIEQVQDPVQDGHVLVRRNHIDALRLNPGAVLDLHHLHAGGALQQLGHDALVRRVEVLDDDIGHAAAWRHVAQEQFQRLQPPGGGADADDGKGAGRRRGGGGRRRFAGARGGFLEAAFFHSHQCSVISHSVLGQVTRNSCSLRSSMSPMLRFAKLLGNSEFAWRRAAGAGQFSGARTFLSAGGLAG